MTEPPRPSGDPGPDPTAPSNSPYTIPGETPGSSYGTPAPSSGAGGGYTMPGGSDYTPPPATPSSGAGYSPPASPSSGAGYPPPGQTSGAGYPPPAQTSGTGYPPPAQTSDAGYVPPSSGAGYPGQTSGVGHTYPSEQQAYNQQAYNQPPGPAYGAGYGAPAGGYGVQPGYQQAGGYGPPPPHGYPTNDDKTYALIAHWGGVAGVVIGGGVLGWVGPLIAYVAKGNVSPTVRAHALSALNFHITWAGAYVIGIIAAIVTCGLLFFVPLMVMLVPLVIGIIGAIKAGNGEFYRYPASIQIIK